MKAAILRALQSDTAAFLSYTFIAFAGLYALSITVPM